MNPKFLTLSENAVWWVPTVTDDGKQSEGRESVEKRMASVLSSLSLSWLLHIHDFKSSVYNCRSLVRLCTSFGGVDFWSWVSSANSCWLTEWLAMMSESGLVYKTNSTGPSEPCGTPNMKGEGEEAELLTTMDWFLSSRYDRNHWSAVERMPKQFPDVREEFGDQVVSKAAERSSNSRTGILSSSIAVSRSLTTRRRAVSVLCVVR